MADITDFSEWSQDHFTCLVLLYASYADFEYSEKEKNHILAIIHPDILETVENIFDSLGDYAQLDLILNLKQKFIKTDEDKNRLFEVLKNHFDSDSAYTKLESGLYQFLQRLF